MLYSLLKLKDFVDFKFQKNIFWIAHSTILSEINLLVEKY